MVKFDSCIVYTTSAKVLGSDTSAWWQYDVWLGKRVAVHVIGTASRCGTVKPHPEIESDSKSFYGLTGAPWGMAGQNAGAPKSEVKEHTGDLPRVAIPRGYDDPTPQLGRAPISCALVERFSYCRDLRTGDNSQLALAHSADCRSSIEKLRAEDPELNKRLDRQQQRQEEILSRVVEAGDMTNKRFKFGETVDVEFQSGPARISASRSPEDAAPRGGGLELGALLLAWRISKHRVTLLAVLVTMCLMWLMLLCRFSWRVMLCRLPFLPGQVRRGDKRVRRWTG